MATFMIVCVVLAVVFIRCSTDVWANQCPTLCVCSPLQGQMHLMDVKCKSAAVPENIPATTAVLSLTGLKSLTHKQFNQSLVHLKTLTIDEGTFENIDLNNSFEGFENVNRLVLRQMQHLSEIDKSAFQILRKLTSITFDRIDSMRVLSMFRSLVCANNQTLREINIICDGVDMLYAEVLDKEDYKTMGHFNITCLSITACSVAVTRPGFHEFLQNLEYLNISYNYISGDKLALVDILQMRNMKVVDIGDQQAHYERKLYRKRNQLTNFKRSRDTIKQCLPIPPKLTYFSARRNKANLNWINFYCIQENNSLKYLDVSSNYLFRVKSRLKGFHSLEYLNLKSIHLYSFPLDSFHELPMLKHFVLEQNNIKRVIESDHSGEIFKNNFRLISLNLAYCSITTLPSEFMYSIRGIEQLNLERNQLSMINITHLSSLRVLNISFNKFRRVSDHFIRSLNKIARNHTIFVDFSNNPISSIMPCCDVVNFITLLKNGKSLFSRSSQYKCIYDNGHEVLFTSISLNELERVCNAYTFGKIMLTVGSITVFLVMTIFALMYRKRWCLKAYILAGKRYLKLNQKYDLSEYRFDAFVAYHERDSPWVRTVLLKHLENENGLKVCIHERDFTLGEPIEENISSAIESSRRVILVVSPYFVTSNWCLLEMRLARQMSFERGRDILIPVILQHIDGQKGSKTLFNILNENTYIEWPHGNAEGQQLFIHRLVDSVKSKQHDNGSND